MSDIEIPEKGDYPFRNVSPTKQNGYVAWIRDHSSYLTAGGIADQLASVGSYATGMLKNFLCLSPLFLLASLVFGWFHFANLERPYFLAGSVALLVFGVACWVDRDKCRPSFYLSSLANRARIGRCGGWSILGVLVGLTTLLVPLSVELLREHLTGLGQSLRLFYLEDLVHWWQRSELCRYRMGAERRLPFFSSARSVSYLCLRP